MFSHYERVKSAVFQRFCEYVRAYALIGDDGGDPQFHLSPALKWGWQMWPVAQVTNTCMLDPSCLLPAHVIESMPRCAARPRPVSYGAMQVTHRDCTAGYKARHLN